MMVRGPHVTLTILPAVLVLSTACGEKTERLEKPWIGIYTLEVTEGNRQTFEMFEETGMPWPSLTLSKDGTFRLEKPEGIGEGVYEVDDKNITLTMTRYRKETPEGELAKPRTVQFVEEYRVLLLEGAEGERWVKEQE